ncbi:hypothetical protein BDU57DRAFT_437545 [Ampelomyces quisqualis]|uniref:C2H2-type domain-containing protein n=1 Tax=Ampelomyces quisqualis TaxID=50730 RepID=A0A6A5R3V0_AMPQU|nr:hypothetical protein BDU57DRAFT_437545 [Ampelomyces quisqualis]
MTLRSPDQQHQKITTISRRLRQPADQIVSAQPLEIPRLRSFRPRRATTLPAPHREPLQSRLRFSQDHLVDSQKDYFDGGLKRNTVSDFHQRTTLHKSVDNLYAPTLDVSSHTAPQPTSAAFVSIEQKTARDYQHVRHLAPTFPPPPLLSVTGSLDFEIPLSITDSSQSQNPFLTLRDMSTLGCMMAPSQYGMNHSGSPPSYPPNYPSSSQHSYAEHRASTSGSYSSSYASIPAILHNQQRPEDHRVLPPYQTHSQPLSRSPYQQQPSVPMRSNLSSLVPAAHGYSYSTSHSAIQNHALGSNASSYPPPQLYPPTNYGVSDYHPLPTMYPPSSTTPAAYPSYASSPSISEAPASDIPQALPSPGAHSNAMMPRILNSRPKPQCWEHGCNGRQFSTFSNLLRHQREKSGTASKSFCPRCGAEFTRTTARNGHMAHDKCKPRRPSDTSH